ncbi:MAG: tRNA (adenosine(37)-N6)-dimethylallyltransferase MiaA [Candidatus Shapirobacteria bacterium]|jgi:tRNA dimethylallyltransferase
MNKILIISGPTATGKTDLAVKLAKLYNGELISADSRQIYQGLDIGTGKDHPKNFKINLIDLINPDESFSVAQYQKLALQKIAEIHSKNKLPIIVGGTGQYIDAIVNPNKSTYFIRPNNFLRFFLNKLSTPALQKIYRFLDKKTFDSLNNSEAHNPHRLIRKIEIKLSNKNIFFPLHQGGIKGGLNILHISLTAPTSFLYPRIDARVQKRLDIGLLGEVKNLIKKYSWSSPGLNTLAYKEFKNYFNKKNSLNNAVKKWRFDEHAYSRRQLTWFKKRENVHFIDITEINFLSKTLDLVKKWYNLS